MIQKKKGGAGGSVAHALRYDVVAGICMIMNVVIYLFEGVTITGIIISAFQICHNESW